MEGTKNNLRKSGAICLVKDKYRTLFDKAKSIVYASKNSTQDEYWTDPSPDVLNHDWLLVLDDYIEQKLYLFFIYANSIDDNSIKTRQYDNKYGKRLHIKIMYDDPDFTDRLKGYKFLPHYKATICYGEKATRSEDASLTKEI